jgi:hypothetical protein
MRVSSGSGWPGPLRHAATVNGILEAAEHYQQQRRTGDGSGRNGRQLSPDLVKIANGTSTVLRAGEIVEFDTLALDDVTRGYPWFTGEVPDETKAFAVMLEGVANDSGAIGLAQIAGCCPALINIQATTDLWAYVNSGDDVLKGDRFWGDVRLLMTPPGTGEQLLWVSFEKSPDTWFVKADAEIVQDATGTVSIWTGATPSDSTFNIASCLNWSGLTVDSGARCKVQRIDRKPRVEPLECPA